MIAHTEHLRRNLEPKSFTASLLGQLERTAVKLSSLDITTKCLPETLRSDGGYPLQTFPADQAVMLYCAEEFMEAFGRDLAVMPPRSTLVIFTPFLSARSVARWGPHLRDCIVERGCEVQIITRKPGKQAHFLFDGEAAIEELIKELQSLGAAVGFDRYVPGAKPMHHKLAILRFPNNKQEPVIWMGSMNILAHRGSEELMQRTQSAKLYDCIADLLKLNELEARLSAQQFTLQLEAALRDNLGAVCRKHGVPMVLKCAKKKFRSYFMSCPNWRAGCPTVNVGVDELNAALRQMGAVCTQGACGSPIEAKRGRTGVYLKCRDGGHFVNLAV